MNTPFQVPSLFLIPEPFKYDGGYHAVMPPFVKGKCTFHCVGRKFTLLRSTSIDSDNEFIRYELLINGRELDVSILFGHFIDDEGETLDDWVKLPYKTEEHHTELSAFVNKIAALYVMYPKKQSVLMKYELG